MISDCRDNGGYRITWGGHAPHTRSNRDIDNPESQLKRYINTIKVIGAAHAHGNQGDIRLDDYLPLLTEKKIDHSKDSKVIQEQYRLVWENKYGTLLNVTQELLSVRRCSDEKPSLVFKFSEPARLYLKEKLHLQRREIKVGYLGDCDQSNSSDYYLWKTIHTQTELYDAKFLRLDFVDDESISEVYWTHCMEYNPETASSLPTFRISQKIQARDEYFHDYYPGVITSIGFDRKTNDFVYDVQFDDGDFESCIPVNRIKDSMEDIQIRRKQEREEAERKAREEAEKKLAQLEEQKKKIERSQATRKLIREREIQERKMISEREKQVEKKNELIGVFRAEFEKLISNMKITLTRILFFF